MPTHALIARKTAFGYESIYVHNDGDLNNLGAILAAHYTDPAKVDALFALGSCSYVGATLENLTPDGINTDANTVAYHRDMGHGWDSNKPVLFADLLKLERYAWLQSCALWYEAQLGRDGKIHWQYFKNPAASRD